MNTRLARTLIAALVAGLFAPVAAAESNAALLKKIEALSAELARLKTQVEASTANAAEDDKEGWRAFVEDACARLGLDAARVDEHALLRLSRRVAHEGARPMAPVSTFILGLVLGADPEADPVAVATALQDAIATAPLPEED